MLGVVLAVAASVAYGSSDPMAGLAARRTSALAVAWWAHVVGAALLVTVAAVVDGAPPLAGLVFGLAGGAVAGLGLLLYYGALARGPMSVIPPLAASGVAVPMPFGALTGQAPGVLGWVGLVVAAVGVLIVARARGAAEEPTPPCPGARRAAPMSRAAEHPGCPRSSARSSQPSRSTPRSC